MGSTRAANFGVIEASVESRGRGGNREQRKRKLDQSSVGLANPHRRLAGEIPLDLSLIETNPEIASLLLDDFPPERTTIDTPVTPAARTGRSWKITRRLRLENQRDALQRVAKNRVHFVRAGDLEIELGHQQAIDGLIAQLAFDAD